MLLNVAGALNLSTVNRNVLLSGATYSDVVTALNPVLWYRFQETTGTNADNAGSLGATGDGTYSGTGYTLGQTGQLGANEAVDFDGLDAKVSYSQNASLNTVDNSTFTVTTLVDIDSDGESNFGTIWSKFNSSIYTTAESGGNVRIVCLMDFSDTDANGQSAVTVSIDTWHLISAVFNRNSDNKWEIYLDNAQLTLSTDIAGVGSKVDDSSQGGRFADNRFNNRNFDGLIDEALFFDKALTLAEHQSIYNTLGIS